MIISKKHLNEFFKNDISIEDMSALLFQLGHENEFKDNLIDLEITPNRGDCLSLRGIARELNVFHKAELDRDKFEEEIRKQCPVRTLKFLLVLGGFHFFSHNLCMFFFFSQIYQS